MSDVDLPVYVARAQSASAIHLVVQLLRSSEDGRRRVTQITEQCGLDDENRYTFRDLFRISGTAPKPDRRSVFRLEPTGTTVSFGRELAEHGLSRRVSLTRSLWGEQS